MIPFAPSVRTKRESDAYRCAGILGSRQRINDRTAVAKTKASLAMPRFYPRRGGGCQAVQRMYFAPFVIWD